MDVNQELQVRKLLVEGKLTQNRIAIVTKVNRKTVKRIYDDIERVRKKRSESAKRVRKNECWEPTEEDIQSGIAEVQAKWDESTFIRRAVIHPSPPPELPLVHLPDAAIGSIEIGNCAKSYNRGFRRAGKAS